MNSRLNSPNGLIGYFRIEDWFYALPPGHQEKIKEYYSLSGNDPRDVDKKNIKTDLSVSNFLWSLGLNALSKNDIEVAKLLFEKSLELSKDITSKHFALMGLTELLYKQRKSNPSSIELCKKYCEKDIEISDDFIRVFKEEDLALKIINSEEFNKKRKLWWEGKERGESDVQILKKLGYQIEKDAISYNVRLPSIPSFSRLAIILEKQGDYLGAIRVCEKAVKLGLLDSNKSSFSIKISNLQNKLNTNNESIYKTRSELRRNIKEAPKPQS